MNKTHLKFIKHKKSKCNKNSKTTPTTTTLISQKEEEIQKDDSIIYI